MIALESYTRSIFTMVLEGKPRSSVQIAEAHGSEVSGPKYKDIL